MHQIVVKLFFSKFELDGLFKRTRATGSKTIYITLHIFPAVAYLILLENDQSTLPMLNDTSCTQTNIVRQLLCRATHGLSILNCCGEKGFTPDNTESERNQ